MSKHPEDKGCFLAPRCTECPFPGRCATEEGPPIKGVLKEKRNTEICSMLVKGTKEKVLAKKFHLSVNSIQRIGASVKR